MSESLQALIKELIKFDHKSILIDEAIELFLNKCQSTVKPETCGYYEKQLRKIQAFFSDQGVRSVDSVTNDLLYRYIALEKARKLKNNSINKVIETFLFVVNYCLRMDLITQNPLKNFKKLRSDDVETKTINEDLLKSIFAYMAALPRTPVNVRDHLMVTLLIDTGIRRSELRHVLLENVNLKERSIYLTHTKTNKHREVYLSEMTVQLIMEYLALVPTSTYLLVNIKNYQQPLSDHIITRTLDKIKKGLKIPESVSISPHKWRHTYATMCLNNGADIVFVQKFLGHSSLRITQRYTHKEAARLKSEHDRYSPVRQL